MQQPDVRLWRRHWLEQRGRARELRNRLVDQQVRQLQAIRAATRRGAVDVLLLGDSSCLFNAPTDTDRAMIPELLRRDLGLRVVPIAGGGYGPRLHGEVLRVLSALDERPAAVVISLCVRAATSTHVVRHPVYSYTESMRRIGSVRSSHDRLTWLGWAPKPSEQDYDRFAALPVRSTWSGDSTIGAYRRALKGHGSPPWPAPLEAKLFDYFHGEVLTAEDRALADLRIFGQRIREYGVATVVYETAPPTERGELHYPGEFAALYKDKRDLTHDAVRVGFGGDLPIVDADLEEADFIDSRDGTEHYNLSGRSKISRAVASELAKRL